MTIASTTQGIVPMSAPLSVHSRVCPNTANSPFCSRPFCRLAALIDANPFSVLAQVWSTSARQNV